MKARLAPSFFDWHYTRWGGILSVRILKIWLKVFRKPTYTFDVRSPIRPSDTIVLAANHQTLLDPPTIFASLRFSNLYKLSPVKFMTWHKYYNNPRFKFFMYSTGCYPSHGEGLTGVAGAVTYAQQGYSSFIFPEGSRTKPGERKKAYEGVARILEQLPDARLILVRVNWERRKTRFSRPAVTVSFAEAPKNLNRNDPDEIMDAIYSL